MHASDNLAILNSSIYRKNHYAYLGCILRRKSPCLQHKNHAAFRDLPEKIFDVSKALLVLIETGPFAKIWGHFLFVMF